MGLITLNLKRVLNWNFIFMSAVATIFGIISLMNFGGYFRDIVFGVDIKYFMLDGYLCLFIFFCRRNKQGYVAARKNYKENRMETC